MMKNTLIFLAAIMFTLDIFCQTPEKISYQAIIRDGNNQLVKNTTIGMQISIMRRTATGETVYAETQKPSSNANGLVTIEIGSGLVLSGVFSSINWANGPYYIKIETDPTGGSAYSITGTSQLLSVPYALHAKTAENGFSGNYNDLENKPDFNGWDNNKSDDFSGNYADLVNRPILFSGSYLDLTNKPALFDGTWASLTGKPFAFPPSSHNHDLLYKTITYVPNYAEIKNKPEEIDLVDVLPLMDYFPLAQKTTDEINTMIIPPATVALVWDKTLGVIKVWNGTNWKTLITE